MKSVTEENVKSNYYENVETKILIKYRVVPVRKEHGYLEKAIDIKYETINFRCFLNLLYIKIWTKYA